MAEKSIKAEQVQTLVNNIKEKFLDKRNTELVGLTDYPFTVIEGNLCIMYEE